MNIPIHINIHFWILEKHACFTSKQTKLWRNRGRYLNIFRLLWFILIYSKTIFHFCYSFNLQSSIFCMSVFQDFDCGLFCFPPCSYDTLCLALLGILKMDFLCFKKYLYGFFRSTPPMDLLQDFYINDKTLGFCTFMQTWSIRSWARVTKFVNLESQGFFLLYLVFWVDRNYNTRNFVLLPCRNRYNFSFTLKLPTTLLQTLATFFYMWNVTLFSKSFQILFFVIGFP